MKQINQLRTIVRLLESDLSGVSPWPILPVTWCSGGGTQPETSAPRDGHVRRDQADLGYSNTSLTSTVVSWNNTEVIMHCQ